MKTLWDIPIRNWIRWDGFPTKKLKVYSPLFRMEGRSGVGFPWGWKRWGGRGMTRGGWLEVLYPGWGKKWRWGVLVGIFWGAGQSIWYWTGDGNSIHTYGRRSNPSYSIMGDPFYANWFATPSYSPRVSATSHLTISWKQNLNIQNEIRRLNCNEIETLRDAFKDVLAEFVR